VLEHHSEEATANCKCLTDGPNFLWVHCNEEGLASFTRWRPNGDPQHILGAISEEFDVDIVSEYEPEYWGFATKEEWAAAWADAAWAEMCKKRDQDEQHFWNEVVRYAKGETAELEQSLYVSSAAAEMAQIAKNLISESPNLLVEDTRPDLIKVVNEKHRQHLVDAGKIPF